MLLGLQALIMIGLYIAVTRIQHRLNSAMIWLRDDRGED